MHYLIVGKKYEENYVQSIVKRRKISNKLTRFWTFIVVNESSSLNIVEEREREKERVHNYSENCNRFHNNMRRKWVKKTFALLTFIPGI